MSLSSFWYARIAVYLVDVRYYLILFKSHPYLNAFSVCVKLYSGFRSNWTQSGKLDGVRWIRVGMCGWVAPSYIHSLTPRA